MEISCLILILSLSAWGGIRNGLLHDEMEGVFQADRTLSQKMESGGCEALLEFLAAESCLLPRNGHPVRGRRNFLEILHSAEQRKLRCIARWEPLGGRISSSGTLAYTYGRYRRDSKNTANPDSPQCSYYASLWRKHTSGEWQILFNMGFIGLEEWRNWDPSISSPAKVSSVEKELMDVDRAFSKLSIEKGYLEAFYSNIADDGINVSSSGGAPANKETYRKRIEALKKQTNPPQVKLVWEPCLVYVAVSNDLGFTSGKYTSTVIDPSGQQNVQRGYYLSIWKRQPDGTWKFIFDSGNQVRE